MHRRVVGLTGGIASGKSTVAHAFRELGVPVIDADALAREVVAPGSPGLAQIVETFGADVLLPDGSLDRKALAARVFADPAARLKLNAITHPRIGALSLARVEEALASGASYVVYEAALLVENNLHRTMPALIVVRLDPETQVKRLMARDQLTADEARARLAAQAPLDDKLRAATHVIDNAGSPADIAARVRALHEELAARLGTP